MNAFAYLNLSQERYRITVSKIISKLKKENYVNLIFSSSDTKTFGDNQGLTIADADFVLSIGGDGTLLQASKLALEYNLPIVGINAGRAGKLCKYTVKEILNAKENPFASLDVSPRDVLEMAYNKEKHLAVNDFVFASRNAGYTVMTNIKTKHRDLTYHASGVIISTPTGSSAYNAAACNCLLDPLLPANIISPICACGEEKAAHVISNTEKIHVSNIRLDDPTDIYCDGVYVGALNKTLTINKHKRKLKLVI